MAAFFPLILQVTLTTFTTVTARAGGRRRHVLHIRLACRLSDAGTSSTTSRGMFTVCTAFTTFTSPDAQATRARVLLFVR